MRRICYLCASDPGSDAPHYFAAAFHMTLLGCEVECICLGPVDRTECATPVATLRTVSLSSPKDWLGQFRFQWQLFCLLTTRRWSAGNQEALLFYVQGSPVTPAAWLALLGLPRRQLIYHTQDFLEPGRHAIWRFFERRVARGASLVVCNERNRARCLASLYQLRNFPAVIPTRLPKAWPQPDFDSRLRAEILKKAGHSHDAATRLIMHVGGMSSTRCSSQLLAALELLPENYLLVICGSQGSADRLHTAAPQESALSRRIIRLGILSFADVLRHCSCCDVGILLYPNDGIGNFYQAPGRLTEYIGAGLPVVASHFPGLESLVQRHGLGRTCDPESPAEIAAAIDALGSQSPETRRLERERLRQLAKAELAYETEASVVVSHLLSETDRQPSPASHANTCLEPA